MSQGGALIKNTLIIAIGKLFTQFLTFLLLPVYTAFLSPKAFGELDLVTLYIGLLAPTLTLQMEMSVFRHLIDVRKSRSDTKNSRIISSAFAVTVAGGVFGVVAISAVGLVLDLRLTPYIAGVFASTVLLNFFLQVARGKGRNDLFAIGSIVTGLINIVLSVIALTVLHASVEGILVALMIANLVGMALLVLKTGALNSLRVKYIDKKTIEQLVGYSWPLVPNHFAVWGISGVSRTIVATVLGVSAVGIYAAANKFGLIYSSLYGVFAMSWTEAVSLHLGKKGDFLSNASNSAVKLFGSLTLLIIASSSIAFPLLVSDDFKEAKVFIPPILVAVFFASLMTHYAAIYLAAKETTRIVKVTFQALALSVGLTLTGIWFIGLWSAVLALVATYVFIAVRRHIDTQRLVKIHYNTSTYAQLGTLGLFVFCAYYLGNVVVDYVALLITAGATVLINKREVWRIYNTVLHRKQ